MTTPYPFVAGAVLTAQSLNDITNLPINDQTASYVLLVGDAGKRVVMNVASSNTVTVNNSVFTTGDTVEVLNKGAGATTITAGAGVTLNGLSLVLSQYQGASITFLSASVALVFPTGGSVKTPRITAFTAGGTFTPAAGVTYAIAHIRGGGGGIARANEDDAGAGGTSSVAFASGTVSATGGNKAAVRATDNQTANASAGVANGGQGAYMTTGSSTAANQANGGRAGDGAYIVAGGAVTAGVGITVTVGAGGTAGTSGAAGGSGYVFIETFE
jgi:hypothetical protein